MKIDRFISLFKRREGKKGIDWGIIEEASNENAIAWCLKQKGFTFQRLLAFFIGTLNLSMVLILIFCGTFGAMEVRIFRSIILSFFLILTFLTKPLGEKTWKDPIGPLFMFDFLLILLTITIQIYTFQNIDRFTWKIAELSFLEKFFGIAEFFLILEAARRTMGWLFAGICFFFLIEPFFSEQLPGILHGPSIDFEQMIEQQFLRDDGIFGIALGMMVTTLSIFLIFGTFLQKTSAGQFFISLAYSIAGRFRGGPAKVAVISSALFGTVSGSVVANVVTTGSVTIPMMKQMGYPKEYAGAVEAVASSGGQLMPPIMGITAFLIAAIVGISYSTVCKHAFIPALLYFFSVLLTIDLRAKRINLKPSNEMDIPSLVNVLRDGGYLLIPVLIIIYLLVIGFSPEKAVIIALAAILVLSMIRLQTRLTPIKLLDALEDGGRVMIPIGVACASVGLIIGSLGASGLATRFASFVIQSSGGHLWVALLYTMIAGLILGMGVPTLVVYIFLAVLVVPALIQMGVAMMAAHLFAFYFGVIANITPPVAMGAFAGAAIAQSGYMKTGYTSMRIGIASYMIPFVFAYAPELLLIGSPFKIIGIIFSTIIGIWALASANEGWLFTRTSLMERVLLLTAALSLIKPGMYTDLLGLSLFGIVIFIQKRKQKDFNR